METTTSIIQKIGATKAIVADGDRTLWRGNVAESMGKMYLKREYDALRLLRPSTYHHANALAAGIIGYMKVKRVERQNEETGEGTGLKIFYDALISNGLGTKNDMMAHANNFFPSHENKYMISLVTFDARRPSFLATRGGSTTSAMAVARYGMTDGVWNIDQFHENGRLKGIEIVITDGEKKLSKTSDMLRKYGIRIEECTVIGDSKADIPLMYYARLSIASPYATEEVNRIAKIRMSAIIPS